jgi:RNA polymerase sigma-70 factor (ECF subfamily)
MPAVETAELLDTSVAAANSALQRARVTMQAHLPQRRADWASGTVDLTEDERTLLATFIDCHERCDAEGAIAAAARDLRITMPPVPACFDGLDVIAGSLRTAFGPEREGDWRLLPTVANRMPTAASYLRRFGDTEFRAFKLDVLRVVDREIAEITTFGWSLFPQFDLPLILPC